MVDANEVLKESLAQCKRDFQNNIDYVVDIAIRLERRKILDFFQEKFVSGESITPAELVRAVNNCNKE